jgi:hypothetical protein
MASRALEYIGPVEPDRTATQKAAILSRTEQGEPLTRICADEDMPNRTTVYDWLEADEVFAQQFRARRARGIHAMAEDTLNIADNLALLPEHKRIMIDTRLRLAGKWLPSAYGDKVQLEVAAPTAGLEQNELPAALGFLANAIEQGGKE